MSTEALAQARERAQRDPVFRERLLTAPLAALTEYDLAEDEWLLVPDHFDLTGGDVSWYHWSIVVGGWTGEEVHRGVDTGGARTA